MSSSTTPASTEIRPGVFRPDWSAVTTSAAQEALLVRLTARESLAEKWSAPLDETGDHLWQCVLRLFVGLGRGPRLDDLAASTGWASDRVKHGLQNLQRRDLLSFDAVASRVLYAYPFTEHPAGPAVLLGGKVRNTLCAVDALGVGAMLQQDVAITARCRVCGTDIRISTASCGRTLSSVSPADAVVWYDLAFEDQAATSCCPNTALFCSGLHLQAWRDRAGPDVHGRRLSPGEALEVGRALFGPLLAEASGTRKAEHEHAPASVSGDRA